jgi:ribonuclease I
VRNSVCWQTAAAVSRAARAGACRQLQLEAPSPAHAHARRQQVYLLALQWPAGRINTQGNGTNQLEAEYSAALAADTVAPGFTIHGMWSHQKGGEPFVNCTQDLGVPPFQPGCMGILKHLAIANFYWPDISQGQPLLSTNGTSELWADQWEKHGSCRQVKGGHQAGWGQ